MCIRSEAEQNALCGISIRLLFIILAVLPKVDRLLYLLYKHISPPSYWVLFRVKGEEAWSTAPPGSVFAGIAVNVGAVHSVVQAPWIAPRPSRLNAGRDPVRPDPVKFDGGLVIVLHFIL